MVTGVAQLEMETDSDDDGGEGVLTGHARPGSGQLPSRPEDVMSASLAMSRDLTVNLPSVAIVFIRLANQTAASRDET